MRGSDRRLPAWLVGLILAIVISVGVLIVLSLLGYGDDPALETGVQLSRQL